MTKDTVAQVPGADAVTRIRERRGARYEARHLLWDRGREISGKDPIPAVRKCGRTVRSGDGVTVRVSEDGGHRSAGFTGLSTCGSVWACPVCSAKIAAGRQGEIERALTAWHALGGRVGLVTLTMRHRKGQRLKSLWDAVSAAWHAAASGAGWEADQLAAGQLMERTIRTGKRAGQTVAEMRIPVIRVVEVTHGDNGWHVHIHALLLFGAGTDAGTVVRVGASMFGRWSAALEREGYEAPSWRHGLDARRLEGDPAAALGEYFVKAQYSASMETARGDLKDSRGGNRTPFGILRGMVETRKTGDLGDWGTPEDEDVWGEWERASKGRRQVSWSQGLRALLLPAEVEQTDAELAEAAPGGEDVAQIPTPVYRRIVAARADWLVLSAFARSDAEGLALLQRFAAEAVSAEREFGVGRARYRRRR